MLRRWVITSSCTPRTVLYISYRLIWFASNETHARSTTGQNQNQRRGRIHGNV